MREAGLKDHVVMITGGSRGLGRALARAFSAAGARVALCARGEEELKRVARELESAGGAVIALPADVTDAPAIAGLVGEVEASWGPVATLINNASRLGSRAPLRDCAPAEWRGVLEVNLTGTMMVSREVLPGMRRAGSGSIINVTSGVGDRPRRYWGAYAVSKAAVEAFTWNLALEEEGSGVRVNAVDPGALRTRMRRDAYPEEDPASVAEPSEAAGVFLWLASDAAREVTGRRLVAAEWPGPESAGAPLAGR